jgi:hypothetical protein
MLSPDVFRKKTRSPGRKRRSIVMKLFMFSCRSAGSPAAIFP